MSCSLLARVGRNKFRNMLLSSIASLPFPYLKDGIT